MATQLQNILKRDFSQIPNDVMKDNSLSRDARCLFAYLCTKPHDWSYYNSVIEADMGCSKDSRIKYMKELVEAGWIEVYQSKNEKGEWQNNTIKINSSPCPKSSAAGNVGGGKVPTHNYTNKNISKDIQKEKQKRLSVEEREAEFRKKVLAHKSPEYSLELLKDFFIYWTEIGEGDKKMRFEKEKTFGIKQRLHRFRKNSLKWQSLETKRTDKL